MATPSVLSYATPTPRVVHAGYAWAIGFVALLPYVGYQIFPPVSRIYDIATGPPSFYVDYFRGMPLVVGLLLSPANFIAAGILAFAYQGRWMLQVVCVLAFVLTLPTFVEYVRQFIS